MNYLNYFIITQKRLPETIFLKLKYFLITFKLNKEI